jgi:hypothetical protein
MLMQEAQGISRVSYCVPLSFYPDLIAVTNQVILMIYWDLCTEDCVYLTLRFVVHSSDITITSGAIRLLWYI